METGNNITQLLADPKLKVDPDWVIGMINACPTFVLPAALLLRRNPEDVDEETRKHLQAIVLLGSADHAAMADYANLTGCDWSNFYPDLEPPTQKGTIDTIDDFLETYGHTSPEDDELLEKLIFNPVAGNYLGAQDSEITDSLEALPEPEHIAQEQQPQQESQFGPDGMEIINTAPAEQATEVKEVADEPEEPLLMESLAKIFIKQRRYERAFEIINTLSLNYPEKSVYFADQLRFLRLLIQNEASKTANGDIQ